MSQNLRQWIDDVLSKVGPPQVDLATHELTEGELNNLVYLSMKMVIGWQMRATDLEVVKLLAGPVKTIKEFDKAFVPVLAQYMWNHILGEPEDTTQDDLQMAIMAIERILFSMDTTTRNDTETK